MLVKWRSLMLALAATIVLSIASVTTPVDRLIEIGIGHLAWRPVSGDIVVVGIDDKSLQSITSENATVPFHAELINKINASGAKRLFIDYTYEHRSSDPRFPDLVDSVKKMGNRAVLAVPISKYSGNNAVVEFWPSESFGPEAQRACICWEYLVWQVWRIPVAVNANGKVIPTFSSIMANLPLSEPQQVAIDYAYDTSTIPTYSATALLNNQVPATALQGKDVVLASMGSSSTDRHYFPGHDLVAGAYIHVVAGETLKRGIPVDLHWVFPLLIAASIICGLIYAERTQKLLLISLGTAIALLLTKTILSQYLINISVGPAALFLAISSYMIIRARHKHSAQQYNPVTSLPNFNAMRALPPFERQCVIAAQIINFDQLLTYLPQESSQDLIRQIARRLELATAGSRLHHDTDGRFAWLTDEMSATEIDAQLSGLAALFNAPITIDGSRIDVKIAFGVNGESGESNAQRLAAARGAAEKAVRNRNLIERYVGSQDNDAAWKLSFHSELEDAMSAGDIWVAYQPQFNIHSGKMCGLEALARWSHPVRGMIPPDQFIVQAEQSQDIYRLTLFVMDRAIQSASELKMLGHELRISVNLSAALLDRSDLASTIKAILRAHEVEPTNLTIEITETAQFEDSQQAFATLAELRHSGIQLSIDDYGTGQSNLEYLTRIEADEIKIDKRFVMTMRDSQRNFEIVKSTIDLAHRLGASAVAEGIEDQATLALLGKLGCDVAQGYHLGKPQLFFEILAFLNDLPTSKSA